MKRITRTPSFLLACLACALVADPALAGPLCEPPPPQVCLDLFDLCTEAAGPDSCLTCEYFEVVEACGKCLANPADCSLANVCDVLADACKAAGGEACSDAYDTCLELLVPQP